jgi:hypothetical protein
MSLNGIGTVSYVDFTPINKKPGFGEDVDSVVMSVFVHFSDPIIDENGNYNSPSYNNYFMNRMFWDTIESGKPYKITLDTNEYWICLKNKSPIKRTIMNIHQVVENGRYLENLIMEQANEIKNLKEIVEKQEEVVRGVHDVVYQLIGGLYCQEKQKGMINTHLSVLGISHSNNPLDYENSHSFTIWPTTRQGDDNSRRIEHIEQVIKTLTNLNDEEAQRFYEEEARESRRDIAREQNRIDRMEQRIRNRKE